MKKLTSMLLAVTLLLCLSSGALAAETAQASVPVTLTVVNTASPISVTVPACLPVSVVDGFVVTANNTVIRNNSKTGTIRVARVEILPGTLAVGSFAAFSGEDDSIAMQLNGCGTVAARELPLTEEAFPEIGPEQQLPIRYTAKVACREPVRGAVAATVIFTIAEAGYDG